MDETNQRGGPNQPHNGAAARRRVALLHPDNRQKTGRGNRTGTQANKFLKTAFRDVFVTFCAREKLFQKEKRAKKKGSPRQPVLRSDYNEVDYLDRNHYHRPSRPRCPYSPPNRLCGGAPTGCTLSRFFCPFFSWERILLLK